MMKPGHLREHLTAAIPQLRRDPDQLLVFIDRGSLVSTLAPSLSFEYRYTLNLIFTDFTGSPDAVMVPLLSWLSVHQSELLANPQRREQIEFEVDVLDGGKVDLSITLPLTERVGVRPREGGGFEIEHYPEPPAHDGLQAGRWEVYLKDKLIGAWEVPPR